MKVAVQQPLWEKIQQFRIDDPNAHTRFSDKLASQNNWTPAYTQRVIEEYRRFIFLCCISPKGASPSYDVDQAWHLHLTYTQNYWKDFCRDTLGKEIHHHPSKGGTDEDHHHTDWYNETLALYRDTFHENPPPDIWPTLVVAVAGWPAAEANSGYSFTYQAMIILALVVPFIVVGFYEGTHPFGLYGKKFLWFYSGLIISSIVGLLILRYFKIKWARELLAEHYSRKADIFQLARFAYGRKRAVLVAIIELFKREVLTANANGKFVFTPSNYSQPGFEKNPLIDGLLKSYSEGDVLSYHNVDACFDNDATYHPELAGIHQGIANRKRFAWAIVIVVMLIGLARCIQGVSNDEPVAYLIVLMVVAALSFVMIYHASKYRYILAQTFENGYRNHSLGNSFTISSELNQFAFFGAAMLASGYLSSDMLHALDTAERTRTNSSDGSSSSGCGSSDSGSSCGGSGCGGCGGGGD